MSQDQKKRELMGFVGVGLDNEEGQHRVTQSEHFFLIGGSEQTHEGMQDIAIHFNKSLNESGKPLRETSAEEAIELLREAMGL